MGSSDVLCSSSEARNESDTASDNSWRARLVAPPSAVERMPAPLPFAAGGPASLAPLEVQKRSKTPHQQAFGAVLPFTRQVRSLSSSASGHWGNHRVRWRAFRPRCVILN